MKKLIFALMAALPSLALAQLPGKEAAKPAAASGPLATVNGVAIPRHRLDTILRIQTERGAQDSAQLRSQIREVLINNELLNQEANRSGLAKRSDVQQQLDLNRQEVIANAVVSDYLRAHPVSDADVRKEYDRARAQTGDKEYRPRHILVANETDARSVITELKRGAKFEELAQKRSLDEGTRPRGGDLDWTLPGNLEKAFADAMVRLEVGKITEAPVRTRFGFHIVRLDEVRPVKFPELDQVKQQIQQRIMQQRVEAMVRDLRAKAKIE
ncbi:MAG: peptidylprolyl isomerase [Betaproteobacteria bacterium]|nr:peptidylprolyl isomerase [Betaproteobacteria bacterium]